MTDLLLFTVEDGLATMTLNRPERRNAVNSELGKAMNETLLGMAEDKSIRALIITGAGDAFCAGGDADMLSSVGEARAAAPTTPTFSVDPIFQTLPASVPIEYRTRYTFTRALPFPVIAAVNGPAIGAGLALTLGADVRFAGPKASFQAGFIRIGAVPEYGMHWTLAQTIGLGPSLDMLLSGRRVDAEEALRLGLVTRICAEGALLEDARAYARDLIARCSPRSLRIAKNLLYAAPSQTFAESFTEAMKEAVPALASAHFREGIAALRERRTPSWPADEG